MSEGKEQEASIQDKKQSNRKVLKKISAGCICYVWLWVCSCAFI